MLERGKFFSPDIFFFHRVIEDPPPPKLQLFGCEVRGGTARWDSDEVRLRDQMCEMRLEFSNFEESLQLLFYSVCRVCFTASISKTKATQILVNKLRNLSDKSHAYFASSYRSRQTFGTVTSHTLRASGVDLGWLAN